MKSRWLTVADDERGTLRLEFNSGLAFVHLTFKQVMAGMRVCKSLFPQMKAWLRTMGHDRVFVIIPEGNDALYRFEKSFGFTELRRIRGHIVMSQDC